MKKIFKTMILRTAACLMLAALTVGVFGCSTTLPVPSPSPVVTIDMPTVLPTDAQQYSRIVTNGAVTLLGTVKKDENEKYFLELKDAVTVEFLHGTADPSDVIEDCTRVDLVAYEDDYVHKEVYEGKEVTIMGVLSNYYDKTKLSIYIYEISMGYIGDYSHAEESSELATEKFVLDYDPETPLPERTIPTTEDGVYTLNYFTLRDETIRDLGNGFAEFYIDFVNAYLNYETSCECSYRYYAAIFPVYAAFEFPLFTADCVYSDRQYDPNAHMIYWSYSTETKEEHDALISEFSDKLDGFLKNVSLDDSQTVKAKKLYHKLATSVKYNYDDMETQERVDAYYGFTDDTGICATFADQYNYLLKMVGIEGYYTSGDIENSMSHAWTTALIDGEYYFFDPTYELNFDSGSGYIFFGITMDQRRTDSAWIEDSIRVGRFNGRTLDEVEISTTPLKH